MAKESKYIIRVDDDYIVSFNGKHSFGKTSHSGWSQQFTEMGAVELSMYRSDAKIFDGKINLKSALDKIYDRMRYGDFEFDRMEVIGFE